MPAQPPAPTRRGLSYEDFEVGRTHAFGRKEVSAEEIIAFGRAFDPQPAHLSEAAAAETTIGRLIASGYHTCAILMRMLADDVLQGSRSLGSPGMDEVRFLKPVVPGDVLTGRITCLEKRELTSRPGFGIVRSRYEVINANDEVVLVWDGNNFFELAPPEARP